MSTTPYIFLCWCLRKILNAGLLFVFLDCGIAAFTYVKDLSTTSTTASDKVEKPNLAFETNGAYLQIKKTLSEQQYKKKMQKEKTDK